MILISFRHYIPLPHSPLNHLPSFFVQLSYLIANEDGNWPCLNHICLIKSDSQRTTLNLEKELVIFLLEGSERNSNTDNGLEA